MKITWVRCRSYADARDYSRVIYLHEWHGKPFYWGKAHNSFFGGHKRNSGELRASGRYNAGYRHWIDGCLRHGASLYLGKLDEEALSSVEELEKFLIHRYGQVMNVRREAPKRALRVEHSGQIPLSIADEGRPKRGKRCGCMDAE